MRRQTFLPDLLSHVAMSRSEFDEDEEAIGPPLLCFLLLFPCLAEGIVVLAELEKSREFVESGNLSAIEQSIGITLYCAARMVDSGRDASHEPSFSTWCLLAVLCSQRISSRVEDLIGRDWKSRHSL